MKLTTPIYKACAKSDVRTYLEHPYYDKEAGTIVATNGHILGVVKVAPDPDRDDVGGYLSVPAMKEALKPNKRRPELQGALYANGNVTVLQSGVEYPRPFADQETPKFPEWQRVVPPSPTAADAPCLAFDYKLFNQLCEAICDPQGRYSGVKIIVPVDSNGKVDPTHAIRIEPANTHGETWGVIMPMRL